MESENLKEDTITTTHIRLMEPTCMLRINACKRREQGGQLQQLWVDRLNNEQQWRAVPVVTE